MSPNQPDEALTRRTGAANLSDGASQVADALRQVAAERRTITYGELAARVLGGRIPARSPLLVRLLGEACEALDSGSELMHASLVVRSDTGIPGEGFFVWLERRGTPVHDRGSFWKAEVERVWDSYRDRQ